MNFRKVFLNPDVLLFLSISFVLIIYALFGDTFNPLSMTTLVYIFSFSVLFFFWFRILRAGMTRVSLRRLKPFISVKVIYCIAYLLFFYSCFKAYFVITSVGLDSLMNFRSLVSNEENELGGKISLGVGLSFPAVLAGWFVAKKSSNKMLSIVMSIMALILAILSTSKIFLMVFLFYILYLSKIGTKQVAFGLLSVIFLFFMSHFALQKFSSNPDDGVFNALTNTFLVYLLGGFGALENLISGTVSIHKNVMFSSIASYLSPFINIDVPDSAILPWTKIGKWNTNVYTAFGYWYANMGSFFVVIMSPILGAYYSLFFNQNKVITNLFNFYRPFLIFCIVFVILGDQFLPALAMHIVYIFFSVVVAHVKFNNT